MKPRDSKFNALLIILIFILLPSLLMASKTGTISGMVTDGNTGTPIPGVSIIIVGTPLKGSTDNDGRYSIIKIPTGKHTLKASFAEYSQIEIPSITVMENNTTNVDFQMHKMQAELGKAVEIKLYATDIVRQEAGIISNSCGDKAGINEPESVVRTKKPVPKIMPTPICPPPAHGGSAIVNGQPYDAMFFKDCGTNPFIDTEDDHLSTFAADIDDASFVMCRSYLERGELPPDEAIRAEEFINHFKYDYESPTFGPFNIHIDGGPSPFGRNCQLIRIGIKGKEVSSEERKPANLVFVIDVSGSMAREDRLELVKQSLRILVDQLTYDDMVGIVVYGTNGRVMLEPTSIWHRDHILEAIDRLHPEGSTNAEEGLRLGYNMADKNFDRRKINRIILCSDGVANVGVTSPDELLKWIKGYAERGITLTSVGFGMGNYNDILMEKLGDKGNGQYAYVANLEQARKIFIENLTGTLQVIARDVKIQIDFNPAVVRSYRLIGYENRDVADNKFRDDKEDGGEIGAGHQVTALYEVKLQDNWRPENLATVFVRFKHPENGKADEISRKISRRELARNLAFCSADLKLAAAAAEFAEILGKSYWAQNSKLDDVRQLAESIREETDRPDIAELIQLITKADYFDNGRFEITEE
jgi:Ca-activated chloride channel homolog